MSDNETNYWQPGEKDTLKRRLRFGWALVFGLGALVCTLALPLSFLTGTL